MKFDILNHYDFSLIFKLCIVIIFWILITKFLIKKIIGEIEKKVTKKHISKNIFFVLQFILNILIGIIASLTIFNFIFRIEFSKFLTSISIVGAAISFAFKDLLTDIVEGMVFIFSGQYKLGDILEIKTVSGDTLRGKLVDISLRNIILEINFSKINCRHSKIESIKKEIENGSVFLDFPHLVTKEEAKLLIGVFDQSKMKVEYLISRDASSKNKITAIRLIGDQKYIYKKADHIKNKILKNIPQ